MGIQLQKQRPKETLPVQYGKSMRAPPKLRWILMVLLLSIPMLFLIYQVVNEFFLIRFSGLVAYDTVSLKAPDEGYIKSLNVQPGQKVNEQQTILKFSSPEAETRLNYLQREKKRITKLMQSLADQTPGHLYKLLDVAAEDVVSSKVVYERFKKYAKKGDMIELQLEAARKNYIEAQRNYAALKQQIKDTRLQTKTLMEVNYKRKILEIENDINKVKEKMQYFDMHSPKPGTVMSIKTHEGEYVSPGQELITIVTKQNLRVIGFIDPKYTEDVYKGKKVWVKFPNNERVVGHIVNTPSYAEKLPQSQMNPMITRENKLIAIIKLDKPIPEIYQVFGIPVSIKLA